MSCLSRAAILTLLADLMRLRRPRLLLRTARHGAQDFRRDSDLKRLLRLPATPPPGAETLRRLMEIEAAHEALRTRPPQEAGDPWRAAAHVEALIALIAEARLLSEAVPRD